MAGVSRKIADLTTATAGNAMSLAEIAEFLAKRQDATLATVRSDGDPHVTPVWYLYDEPKLLFTLGESRLHLRHLRRSGRATVLIDEDMRLIGGWRAGARAVMFSGPVEIISDPQALAACEERMGDRYLGDAARDPEFLATVDGEPRHLVVLTPARTLSWDYTKT